LSRCRSRAPLSNHHLGGERGTIESEGRCWPNCARASLEIRFDGAHLETAARVLGRTAASRVSGRLSKCLPFVFSLMRTFLTSMMETTWWNTESVRDILEAEEFWSHVHGQHSFIVHLCPPRESDLSALFLCPGRPAEGIRFVKVKGSERNH